MLSGGGRLIIGIVCMRREGDSVPEYFPDDSTSRHRDYINVPWDTHGCREILGLARLQTALISVYPSGSW